MLLDVRRSGLASHPLLLVLVQKLSYQVLSVAINRNEVTGSQSVRVNSGAVALLSSLGNLRVIGKRNLVVQNVLKRRVPIRPFEWRRPVNHLVDQHTQSPPIHPARVPVAFDHLGRNVLFRAHERVGSDRGGA